MYQQCVFPFFSEQIEEFQKSEDTVLSLEPSNGYLRKLTYQTLGQRSAIVDATKHPINIRGVYKKCCFVMISCIDKHRGDIKQNIKPEPCFLKLQENCM